MWGAQCEQLHSLTDLGRGALGSYNEWQGEETEGLMLASEYHVIPAVLN